MPNYSGNFNCRKIFMGIYGSVIRVSIIIFSFFLRNSFAISKQTHSHTHTHTHTHIYIYIYIYISITQSESWPLTRSKSWHLTRSVSWLFTLSKYWPLIWFDFELLPNPSLHLSNDLNFDLSYFSSLELLYDLSLDLSCKSNLVLPSISSLDLSRYLGFDLSQDVDMFSSSTLNNLKCFI